MGYEPHMPGRLWKSVQRDKDGATSVELRVDGDRFELDLSLGGAWGSSGTRYSGKIEGDGVERILRATNVMEYHWTSVEDEPTEEVQPCDKTFVSTWHEDGRVTVVVGARTVALAPAS
jgi:hypothetical protein